MIFRRIEIFSRLRKYMWNKNIFLRYNIWICSKIKKKSSINTFPSYSNPIQDFYGFFYVFLSISLSECLVIRLLWLLTDFTISILVRVIIIERSHGRSRICSSREMRESRWVIESSRATATWEPVSRILGKRGLRVFHWNILVSILA